MFVCCVAEDVCVFACVKEVCVCVCVCVCEKESSILCEMVCEMLNSCVMIKRLTPHFLCTCVNIPCPV